MNRSPNRQVFQRRKALRVTLIGLVLFACASLWALDPSKPLNKHIHQVWQAAEGLPQNSIQALVQATDGYLWMGTQEGLVRFDGAHFHVYDKVNTPAFRNHDITALFVDGPRLWIGNRAGHVLVVENGEFHTTTGTGKAGVICFTRDAEGKILAGTYGSGVYQWEGDHFVPYAEQGRLAAPGINAMLDDNGAFWVATSENGLIRFHQGQMTRFTTADGLSGDRVYALAKDHEGTLWVGEESGLNRFDGKGFQSFGPADGLIDPYVISIFEDRHHNLWLGTYNNGIALYKNGQFTFYTSDDQTVSNNNITHFLEDVEGNLWVGTGNGGLNQYAESRFFTLSMRDGITDNIVWTVYDDPRGGLWMVTNDGGIFEYRDGQITDYRERYSVGTFYIAYNLLRDRGGAFWVGTDAHGLLRDKDGKVTHYQAEKDGFGDDGILCMTQAPNDDLWIGTFAGLARFRDGAFVNFTTKDGLPDDIVSAVMVDRDGVLWLGTEKGVVRMIDGQFKVLTTADGLLSDRTPYLFQDSLGAVWTVSEGLGVNRILKDEVHTFRTDDGLFSQNVFLMLEDNRGALWFSSNVGLYRIPTADFPRYQNGEIDRLRFQGFGAADGMISVECTFGGPMSGTQSSDGGLWFPTIGGVVEIDPDNVAVDQTPSHVLVEEVRFDGGKRRNGDSRPVPPGSGNFEFHYTSLSFKASERIRFQYLLEGYDRDWIDAGTRRAAYYSDLPPGSYRFLVKGTNSAGVWNPEPGEMRFQLNALYYQTPLFRGAVVVALFLLIWLMHSFNIKRHERHRQELERLVEARKAELDHTKRELVQLNSQLAENARIEGMAEIAADVLHNIGNELNTAGTSALIMNQIFDQKETNRLLERIAELVVDNADELGHFIQNDPRGQRLPAALSGIENLLEDNRRDFMEELTVFKSHILKIKKVVEVQQDMRKRLRELEPTDLNIILEDVLQMHTNLLRTCEIELVQDYRPLPLVNAYRSDLFQALNNMVHNACEALRDAPPENPRKLIIRTVSLDSERVQIEIQDTGRGMDADELPLIFENGYTKKLNRSGFGLHYSLSVIEELSGAIHVTSAGPDRGSKFAIVLPVGAQKPDLPAANAAGAVH